MNRLKHPDKFDKMAQHIYLNTEMDEDDKPYIAAALRRVDRAAYKRGLREPLLQPTAAASPKETE